MNDENEIIKLFCATGATPECGEVEGTYKELFGDIPSLVGLPKIACSECDGPICLEMTGRYRNEKENNRRNEKKNNRH